MSRRQKIAIAGTVLSIVAAAFSAASLVGKEARLVDVIALFAAGFGGGASLVVALRPASRA